MTGKIIFIIFMWAVIIGMHIAARRRKKQMEALESGYLDYDVLDDPDGLDEPVKLAGPQADTPDRQPAAIPVRPPRRKPAPAGQNQGEWAPYHRALESLNFAIARFEEIIEIWERHERIKEQRAQRLHATLRETEDDRFALESEALDAQMLALEEIDRMVREFPQAKTIPMAPDGPVESGGPVGKEDQHANLADQIYQFQASLADEVDLELPGFRDRVSALEGYAAQARSSREFCMRARAALKQAIPNQSDQ